MSVDRIATSQQSAFFLNQINHAGAALDKTNQQIASGKLSNTYAGFGDQTQVLTATLSAQARNDAYGTATTLATTQVDMQDTQLTSLADLGAQLKKAVSDSVANNDASNLMSQVQSIFDQAASILNSKDANGDYIYSGGKSDTAPMTVSSLSALVALPSVGGAFANGDYRKSVQVGDGQTITYGVTASDAATGLMQALKDIGSFDAGSTGNFAGSANLTQAQGTYLTGAIATLGTVATALNTVTAKNGNAFNQLQNAGAQQTEMNTLYKTFVGDMRDTNLADAATQMSLNQTALQAAMQVTASLNKLSLLNYLPISG